MPGAEVALAFRGSRRLRPPRAELRLDVAVSNRAEQARWAIVADTLAAEPVALAAEGWSVGAYLLGEGPRAVAVHAVADGGWYAVLIPGGAEVRLEGVPFAFWGEPPGTVELELVMATGIAVDGEPLLERLGLDASTDAGAEVDAGPLAQDGAVVAALTGGPAAPLKVAWADAEILRRTAVLDGR